MSGETNQRRLTWILHVVLWSLVIFVFSFLTGCTLLLETPFHFLLGWFLHAQKALPPFLEKWRALLLPAGCLVLAGILIHRFICRCLEAKGKPRTWRPANTVASLTLVLLGCGAAIALSGVVHQAVWLLGDRWIENRGRKAELSVAVSNTRQLLLGLYEFHEIKGRYPNSFRELETELGIPIPTAWTELDSGALREPFILLHPGRVKSADADEPLIVSPIIQSSGNFAVGYGDNSVRSLPAKQFEKLLEEVVRRKTEASHPP